MSRPLKKISSTTSVAIEVNLRTKMMELIGPDKPYPTQTELIEEGIKSVLRDNEPADQGQEKTFWTLKNICTEMLHHMQCGYERFFENTQSSPKIDFYDKEFQKLSGQIAEQIAFSVEGGVKKASVVIMSEYRKLKAFYDRNENKQ